MSSVYSIQVYGYFTICEINYVLTLDAQVENNC